MINARKIVKLFNKPQKPCFSTSVSRNDNYPRGIIDLPEKTSAKNPIGTIDDHPWQKTNVDGIRIKTDCGLETNPTGSVRVLVRGIGPSLMQFGIADALQGPMLEIHDSNDAIIAQNDNWRETQQTLIQGTGIPPSDDREAAVLQPLPPGNYTAVSTERTLQAVRLSAKSATCRNEPETSSRPGTLAENFALIANDFES